MSHRNIDRGGRLRSRTVGFRVSDDEAAALDRLVATSGLTKQDYIIDKLLDREVTVIPSTRVQKALEDCTEALYRELRRLESASKISMGTYETLGSIASLYVKLRIQEGTSDTERERNTIIGLEDVRRRNPLAQEEEKPAEPTKDQPESPTGGDSSIPERRKP